MERKTTKRVAEAFERGLYREVLIELTQHYHDSTKKLVKTVEGERKPVRLLRRAKPGEKADTQLMDAATFEVLGLMEVIHDEGETDYSPDASPPRKKTAPKPKPVVETYVAPTLPAGDTPVVNEPVVETGDSETPDEASGDEQEAPEGDEDEDPADDSEETDDGENENEDEDNNMATKKTKKKVAKKVARKSAPPKAPKAPKEPKEPKKEKAAKSDGEKSWTKAVDLGKRKLNPKETRVLEGMQDKGLSKLDELAALFKSSAKNAAQAGSWARNSVRRLVRGGLAEQAGRGAYKLTAKGKSFDAKKAAQAIDKAKE